MTARTGAVTSSGPFPEEAADALVVRGLTRRFGDHVAVDDISLAVHQGEVFGLLGPNGAGKTTTIRVVTTLLPAQRGEVSVFGLDTRRQPMAVRRFLGYVPQQLSVEGGLTDRENVALFARLFDVPRAHRVAVVGEVLDLVGLADAADRLAATYSGGMVRRLELAQALVNRPRLLVLDEPTIGLDPVARAGVWERITGLVRADGMTVLITPHYMEKAQQHCARIALMDRGRIRAQGTPDELRATVSGHPDADGDGPDPGVTLDDVFRRYTGNDLQSGEGFRDVPQRAAPLVADPPAPLRPGPAPAPWLLFPRRVAALCLVELQKLGHDRTELFTRAISPRCGCSSSGRRSPACAPSPPARRPTSTSSHRACSSSPRSSSRSSSGSRSSGSVTRASSPSCS